MFELLEIFFKWVKYILGGSLLAALLAAGASLLLKNQYLSKTIFLPTNPSILDRLSFFPEEGNARVLYFFGDRNDIDRLISLGNSQGIKKHVIEKYNLYEHYDIDSTSADAPAKMEKVLSSKYKIIKNAKGAVELTITDVDPNLAAEMANELTAKLDELNKSFIRQKQIEIYNTLGEEVKNKNQEVIMLKDSVQRQYKRDPNDTITLGFMIDRTEKIISDYSEVKLQYDQYDAILKKNISTLYLIEKAFPAVKKDSPKRALLVLGVFIFSFITLLIAAVIVEQYRRYRTERTGFV